MTTTFLSAQKKRSKKGKQEQKKNTVISYDAGLIIMDKNLWKLPIQDFYQRHGRCKFQWQSAAKYSLRSEGTTSHLFGQKSGEIVIKSEDSLVKYITISLYNKGDNNPGDFP